MNTVTVSDARTHIRDLIDSAIAGQPTCLTRSGKVVAVVVPASYLLIGRDIPADSVQAQPTLR